MKTYELAVVIGRFQIFHHGHRELIEFASSIAERTLILIGSAERPRSYRNPFSYGEREWMVGIGLNSPFEDIRPLRDYLYDDARWAADVRSRVCEVVVPCISLVDGARSNVCVVHHDKDGVGAAYRDLFDWADVIDYETSHTTSSTDIRREYFMSGRVDPSLVPENVKSWLAKFRGAGGAYDTIVEEYDAVIENERIWAASPFKPIANTVDALVVHDGHILLITRKKAPGRGLLAMPGGYLDYGERLYDGIVRELCEETSIHGSIDTDVLKSAYQCMHVGDHPRRSSRGRSVTHVGVFDLSRVMSKRPEVAGADDAIHADWYPIGDIQSDRLFDDHYDLICTTPFPRGY
jgi:bifunctional NMN adenylyltransferase/nudix hydrolase